MEIVEEARGRTKMNIEEKKRKLAKEKKSTIIDEDNPIFLKKAIAILTMKLFADLERKRVGKEDKVRFSSSFFSSSFSFSSSSSFSFSFFSSTSSQVSSDAQKKRDEEDESAFRKEMRETYAKNWEESRQGLAHNHSYLTPLPLLRFLLIFLYLSPPS
jgi:hypothetical protein